MNVAEGSTTRTLDAMMDLAEGHARRSVPEAKDIILPIADLYNPDTGVVVVGLALNNTRANVGAIRAMAIIHRATMAVVVQEAWTTKYRPNEDTDPDIRRVLAGEWGVKDLPPEKRQDIVMIYAEGPGRECRMRSRVVEIGPDGKKTVTDRASFPGKGDLIARPGSPNAGAVRGKFYPLLPANMLSERLNGNTNFEYPTEAERAEMFRRWRQQQAQPK